VWIGFVGTDPDRDAIFDREERKEFFFETYRACGSLNVISLVSAVAIFRTVLRASELNK